MPFVTDQIIDDCIGALETCDAVDVAIPTVDTIIRVDDEMRVSDIPNRKYVMRGLTPQAFRVRVLKQAHECAERDNNTVATDDCALVLHYGLGPVHVVQGDVNSLKVTYPEDVYLAEKLFQIKGHRPPKRVDLQRLRDRVLVVFGAGRGIGKCMLDVAEGHGARIYGFSRRSGVDVRKPEDIARALAEVAEKEGRIDYVAATAAVLYSGKLETRPTDEIVEEIETNLLGSIHIVKASHPYLARSKGSLVLFAGTSYTRGRALYSTYTSTKAAIVNLVQGVAEEFQRSAVRINAMNPERIAGEMRRENFGEEDKETLLAPEVVAEAALRTLISNWSGQIVDVKKA
jgi:2-C-methyl-D-erythritol 4-phosphate cytidylyltransferase